MRCPACLQVICVCAELPRVATEARFVLIRHALEIWKPSNTGRLAALALPNSELHEYGARDREIPLLEEAPGTCLLFPTPDAHEHVGRVTRIIVLDGTWHQARHMAQRIPWLWKMPRMSLTARPRLRMRKALHKESMATLEAIAGAVEILEGSAKAQLLFELYDKVVRRATGLMTVSRNHPV